MSLWIWKILISYGFFSFLQSKGVIFETPDCLSCLFCSYHCICPGEPRHSGRFIPTQKLKKITRQGFNLGQTRVIASHSQKNVAAIGRDITIAHFHKKKMWMAQHQPPPPPIRGWGRSGNKMIAALVEPLAKKGRTIYCHLQLLNLKATWGYLY